jgi:hypothetical protein
VLVGRARRALDQLRRFRGEEAPLRVGAPAGGRVTAGEELRRGALAEMGQQLRRGEARELRAQAGRGLCQFFQSRALAAAGGERAAPSQGFEREGTRADVAPQRAADFTDE